VVALLMEAIARDEPSDPDATELGRQVRYGLIDAGLIPG
jgi:hypothetical protein